MAFFPAPTNGNDVVNGDNANDSILALAGADLVNGNGGNDTLDGGEGNDTLLGAGGNDILYGRAGDDRLEGGDGILDQLFGGLGNDVLIGGLGGSVLNGEEGNDTFIRSGSVNQMFGGAGYDIELATGSGRRGAVFAYDTSSGVVKRDVGRQHDEYLDVEAIHYADGRVVFDLNDPVSQVVRLYQSALGRQPDQGGLHFWEKALESQQFSLVDLAGSFIVSNEYVGRFGAGLNNTDFMVRIYQNILGRQPEQEGLNFWVNSLDQGNSRSLVLSLVSESPENRGITAPLIKTGIWDLSESAAQVARLYDTALGRLPDVGGLQFWRSAIDEGRAQLTDLADAFIGSNEFQATYGSLSNVGFVQRIYQNTLDRAGDAEGVNFWTSGLDAGAASRRDVVLAFSESLEHQNLTDANIVNEQPGQFGILFAG